ncbi:MAG: Phosphatidylglycerol--prolipoprotein diacylglyceryl transferase [Chlamydiia bacterium]|nr:Phosphatidylglycerol--prolipoprotein diacylglyceryl transferase [Chlamydiia bacterium]
MVADFLGWFFWDPSRFIFVIPYLNIPVAWYGLFFASGYALGYYLFIHTYRRVAFLDPLVRENQLDFKDWKGALSANPEMRSIFGEIICDINEKEMLIDWLNSQVIVGGGFDKGLLAPGIEMSGFRQRVERFFVGKVSPELFMQIRRRLALEDLLKGRVISTRSRISQMADRVLIYLIAGTVIGARVAHILFYEPLDFVTSDPLVVFRIWEGGLASHGGVVCVLIAVAFVYRRILKRQLSHVSGLMLTDTIAVFTLIEGFFIRLGNFFNQEIVGVPTNLAWGIIFGSPRNAVGVVPRHPTQLYEGIFYLILGVALFLYWRKNLTRITPGRLAGFAIAGAFLFRFFVERLKPELSVLLEDQGYALLMGQYLSIPLVLIGLAIAFYPEIAARLPMRRQKV